MHIKNVNNFDLFDYEMPKISFTLPCYAKDSTMGDFEITYITLHKK